MENVFDRLHGAGSGKGDGRPVLTVNQFFGKEGNAPYFTPSAFIDYVKSLRPLEVEQLQDVFSDMGEGLRITDGMTRRKDKGGRRYVFPKFQHGNADPGKKVIIESTMYPFLKAYMASKFVLGFTLEEAVEEALNS